VQLFAKTHFKISQIFQCGNYGIGGHYGTHPDYYDYEEEKFYDPESNINRISTVMAVLEAPEAGFLHKSFVQCRTKSNKENSSIKFTLYLNLSILIG